MTLVEMMVTSAVLLLVTGVTIQVMITVQAGVERQIDRSRSNDQARLAVEQLDREIRSGNLLYDPQNTAYLPAGTPAGMGLLVYTQSNFTTRNPGNRCVQWRVNGTELQRRDWSVPDPFGTVSGWRVVAEDVVNLAQGVPAFARDTVGVDPNNPTNPYRAIIVTVLVQVQPASGNVVRIQQTVQGRNTQFAYPVNVCTQYGIPEA